MITFRQLGRYGRFANQLFQIAGVIGIATMNNYAWAFPYWKNYDHRNFSETEEIAIQEYFQNPLPVGEDLERFPEQFVHWGWHGFALPDNHSYAGHFQAPRYFAHCMDLIRHYFRMKDEPKQNDYIAIHWRAGDYTWGRETYHPRQERDYYAKAMQYFPGAKFLVFSDDQEGFKKMMDGYEFEYSTETNYLYDFRLMKRCKSFIISNSSYSLMAALLGEHPDKKIVCPSLWFGDAAGGMNGNDCYPEGAIVI